MPNPFENLFKIEDVTDTAYLAASYRARESKHMDPHFRVPLERSLKNLTIGVPDEIDAAFEWTLSVRTPIIDQMLLSILPGGFDTVVNLGCGFDTRPYRLKLPPSTHWIDVDLQSVIEAKNKLLKDEIPICKVTRVALDLSKQDEVQTFFGQALSFGRFVVITEGLLIYLTRQQVLTLTVGFMYRHNLTAWVTDLVSVDEVNRFLNLGWILDRHYPYVSMGKAINRPAPKSIDQPGGDAVGIYAFTNK